jgi:nitrous oxide reductase
MPSQDAQRPSDEGRHLSRRSMLRGAATAGAAGLAVTAMGAAATPAFAATKRPATAETHGEVTHEGPIMVHVRDAKSGDIEVFSGTSKTRVTDKHLAALITKAIG